MAKGHKKSDFENLPACAAEYISKVVRKMRYRRKVRADVQAELTAHFEDELKECKTQAEKEQKAEQVIAGFGDAKLLAVLLRRAKKRCRPLWRTVVARTFQASGITIACLILYVVWFFSGKPVITTDYIAELNRIVRPVADDNLNAAPLYHKAAELVENLPDDMKELLGKKYDEVTAEQKQLIAKWLTDNEETLGLVIAGTKKPYYWREYATGDPNSNQMMGILVPHLAEFRRLAYSLRWRIWLSAEQGQYQAVFDDIKSCYRFGQHLKDGVFLVEQLVGFSIERSATEALFHILCEHKIDLVTLTKLQQDFEEMTTAEDFTIDFEAEKLATFDAIQRSFTGSHYLGEGHIIPKHIYELYPMVQVIGSLSADYKSDSTAEKQEPSWLTQFISGIRHDICEFGGFIYEGGIFVKKGGYILFLHPDKQKTFQAAEELYDYWEGLAGKTPYQIRIEGLDTEEQAGQIIGENVLLELLEAAFGRIIELSHLNKTESQALVAVLALLRHKNDKQLYPENLEELVEAGYLKKLPMDPYSDKPLVYKKTDTGFVLYSVGPDFTDNGGEPSRYRDGRVRKWRHNGDTVFWPLPKPQAKQ